MTEDNTFAASMREMEGWQSIETAPENTWVLAWCPWLDGPYIVVTRYRWIEEVRNELVHEVTNASGRRRIYQEHRERVRRWENGGDADLWMPLPAPPREKGPA